MEPRSIKDTLRAAYDADADRRDAMTTSAWRMDVINSFAAGLESGGARRVLELGCGTGQVAAYMADQGFEIKAIDLSPGNVSAAIARGVDAIVADFAALPYDDAVFDAAFALNSLLHVPKDALGDAMEEIHRVLTPGARLLVVVWGGIRHEGTLEDEWLDPPRYFSFYTDEQLVALDFGPFIIDDFSTRDDTEQSESQIHSQVLTLVAS